MNSRNHIRPALMALAAMTFVSTDLANAADPIVQTKFTADPAPFVHDGVLYLYTGHDADDAPPGMGQFRMRDWLLYTTTDMVNWTDRGTMASLKSFEWIGWGGHENGAWALQTIKRNGKFYMYVTAQGGGIGVLVADHPMGPFKDPLGKPLIGPNYDTIDPTVMIDNDGQAYLYWGNPNLWYVKLNEDMISTSGEFTKDPNISKKEGQPDPFHYQEGPWVWKHGDHYYNAYASTCCPEGIGYAMAKIATGPWEFKGYVMRPDGRSSGNHPGIIDYKGKSYVFGFNYKLNFQQTDKHHERRSVCVTELKYNPDGTIQELPWWEEAESVAQFGALNPYTRIEGETIAWSEGMKSEPISEGGMNVYPTRDGAYLMVRGVDFGAQGAATFTASVALGSKPGLSKGGSIELHLDRLDGPSIGTLPVSHTGGKWKSETTAVKGATGVHDLILVFKGDSTGEPLKLDHWSFAKKGASPELSAPVDVLANWRFEQVQRLDGSRAPAMAGESLTGEDSRPVDPRPFAADETGNGNLLQVEEPKNSPSSSPSVFSDDVPAAVIDGKTNTRSLALKGRDYHLSLDRTLAFSDLRKSWVIDASVMTKRTEDSQVFLCKDGTGRSQSADLAIGYDPERKQFYVEAKGADGGLHRVWAGGPAETGKWYNLRAAANYDTKTGQTRLRFAVKPSVNGKFGTPESITYKGPALPAGGAMWTLGRGFPIGKFVTDGGIDEVRISGEGLPRVPGQNPIFTDTFTADPAALVVGDTVYCYVGHDAAGVGMFFHMPEWLCYSTKDMKTWTPHGVIMKPEEFAFARPGVAWAAQVISHDGKYYFYTTLRQKDNNEHCIGVAVGDSPTGPFKDARGTPLITDGMTTDSSRANADIDPTVFIDDDGTPWLMWGNGDFYLARLKRNMIELDGPIQKVPRQNVAEGPWLFKRKGLYYNVYAADVPGTQPEQIAYATAEKITGPWTYRGLVTGPARNGFTIHPSVIEFKNQWYFFYHDGSTPLNGIPGGDVRRSVCLEYLYFNPDGTIRPVTQTNEGLSLPPRK